MIRTRKVASSGDADMDPLWGQGRDEKVYISCLVDSWQGKVRVRSCRYWNECLASGFGVCCVYGGGLEAGRLISRLLSWTVWARDEEGSKWGGKERESTPHRHTCVRSVTGRQEEGGRKLKEYEWVLTLMSWGTLGWPMRMHDDRCDQRESPDLGGSRGGFLYMENNESYLSKS